MKVNNIKMKNINKLYYWSCNFYNRKENGITLVALVITIILLLILAGISIISLKNNNIINKAVIAKNGYEIEQQEEEESLSMLEDEIDNAKGIERVGTKLEGVKILDKQYTFTCIDTNYQGYNLFLCDEVIPYSICGPNNSVVYKDSSLRNWLNNNAPENAVEVTLEDTGTTEKMFILSKEENEKYEEYTAVQWEGYQSSGNFGYWTRTFLPDMSGNCMYVRYYNGTISYQDIYWTGWHGCKPVFCY